MILDTISQLHLYKTLSLRLACGLEYLRTFSPSTPVGKYPLDDDKVYALVQSYSTSPAIQNKFESHRNYLDIQYVARGEEIIQYLPLAQLIVETPYNSEKDCALYKDPTHSTPLLLLSGSFAIFYPEDGHKPRCLVTHSRPVKKVVIKVQL